MPGSGSDAARTLGPAADPPVRHSTAGRSIVSDEPRVLVRDDRNVRLITLNRGTFLNAFDREQYAAFNGALKEAAADDDVHAVVVTGTGRAFSAGADVYDMRPDSVGGSSEDSTLDSMLPLLENYPKPLIAAVNGLAVGIGCTMLGHFDILIMGRSGRLRMPFATLGLSPEAGSTVLLPAAIGWQRAAVALFIGDWIEPDQAVEWGLALSVSEDESLIDDAMELGAKIAQTPLTTLVETKKLLLAARTPAVEAARQREGEALKRTTGSPANLKAVAELRAKWAADAEAVAARKAEEERRAAAAAGKQ
jgi:enoyl-CoA hydratase/carnithine racemase